jgi:hypothetical protein
MINDQFWTLVGKAKLVRGVRKDFADENGDL